MSHAHERGSGVTSSNYMGWEQSKGDWQPRGNLGDLLKGGGKGCWVGKAKRRSLLHRLSGPPTPSLLLSIYPLLITCNAELTTEYSTESVCGACPCMIFFLRMNSFPPYCHMWGCLRSFLLLVHSEAMWHLVTFQLFSGHFFSSILCILMPSAHTAENECVASFCLGGDKSK